MPVLRTHDARGNRVDEVEFHPSWHWLMTQAVGAGLTAEPWTSATGSGAHVRRAAGFVLWSRVEAGHGCPVSMTYAAGSALRHDATVGARWLPALASRSYDFGIRPVAQKSGAIAGMGMTEKQGGSDVRANTTRAVPAPGGPLLGETYRLTGHKWFCSAPMSHVFSCWPRPPADSPASSACACPRRRHAQPLRPPAPQGQARPLERLERGRVMAPGQPDR